MTLTLTPETEARLLSVAARRNQTPEVVVDTAIEQLWQQGPPHGEVVPDAGPRERDESEQDRQERLHALMDELIAKAHATVPEPDDSPARTYYRASKVGRIIAAKYRKQGFNV